MKKIFLLFLLFNFMIFNVFAEEINRYEVELIKCEDALTSWVSLNNEKFIIRLIATDTSDGELNDIIDSYVCNILNDAKKIEIEYDPNYEGVDEYNRHNVWVYADSKLLQESLIKEGYAQVNYVKGDYLYLNHLCDEQRLALENNLGIWNYPNQEEKYCISGITLEQTASNELEEEEKKEEDNIYLRYDLLFLNILIVILVLIIGIKRRKNG